MWYSVKSFDLYLFSWYRVIAAPGQRITTEQPPNRECCAPRDPMPGNRLNRVLRTTGDKAAGRRQQWRKQVFIDLQRFFGDSFHRPAPFWMAAKSWWISVFSRANSMSSTDLRGCNTTSTGQVNVDSCVATAARILRRIRLRATAPPSTLPTAKPMRGPENRASCRSQYNAVTFLEKLFFASWYTR